MGKNYHGGNAKAARMGVCPCVPASAWGMAWADPARDMAPCAWCLPPP